MPAERAPYETERACGGAMLVPRAALELVGLLDEALFAYAEDVDWSVRARAPGLRSRRSRERRPPSRIGRLAAAPRPPTSVYYALRNGLVVAERDAPLGRLGDLRRRAEAGGGVLRPGASVAVAARGAPRGRRRASRRAAAAGSGRGGRVTVVSVRGIPGSGCCSHCPPRATDGTTGAGRCAVCGEEGRQVHRAGCCRPSSRGAGGRRSPTRESMFCEHCGSSLRVRRIAEVLVELYAERATTLAELVREDAFRALRIAEINSIGRMHPSSRRRRASSTSSTRRRTSRHSAGRTGASTSCSPRRRWSTCPTPPRARARRCGCCGPGGRHVFTVPVDPSLEATRSRADLPAEHHGRGGGPFALVTRKADMVVHTDFGRDLPTSSARRGSRRDATGTGSSSSRSRPGRWTAVSAARGAGHGRGRAGRLAALGRLLLEQGYEVAGVVRREPAAYAEASAPLEARVGLVQANLLDRASLVAALRETRPTEVYNLAAPSFVPRSWDEPILTAEFAAVGATSMLEAIREVDPSIRFYQASSSEIFGEPRETPQTEETAPSPLTPYGVAKAYAHFIAGSYRRRYGMFTCCGILYNHESPLRPVDFLPRRCRGRRPRSRSASSTSSCSATSRRAATGATRATTSARCG